MVDAQQMPAIVIDRETTPYREPLNHVPPIYHLHIPRTAGTSFRMWLAELFDSSQCCEIYHAYELKNYQTQDLSRYRFYAGHHGYDLIDRLDFWRDLYNVTILRDPIGRELSQLNYLSGFGKEEISFYGKYSWEFEKIVQSLQGRGRANAITSDFYLSNYANMQVRCLTGGLPPMSKPRKLGSKDLDTAKSNLTKLSSFGLVEEMERSVLLICASLGLPYRPVPLYNLSQGPDLETIDSKLRAAIVSVNELDIELYNFARTVFEERAACVESVTRAASPDSQGALQERFVKSSVTCANGVQPLRGAVLDASNGMILTGWHARFFYEPLSRWIRWGGPGRESKLYLPLDRSTDRAITVEIPFTSSSAMSGGLTVSIDSNPTETQRSYVSIPGSEYCLLLQFAVPAAHSRQEAYTEIAFHSPDEVDERETFVLGRIWVR